VAVSATHSEQDELAPAAEAAAVDPADELRFGPRVVAYERRTAMPLIAASLVYFVVFATEVLWVGAPPAALVTLGILDNLIWGVFIVDFAIRIWLADNRLRYFISHPVDIVVILLPMLRPLRSLRVLASARILVERGQFFEFSRVAGAIAVGAVFTAVVGALVVLDLERGVAGSSIDTFGQSLWWAAVTMTTVGYGDTYPITPAGRVAAVGMMIVGISLLGTVTGAFATWVSTRISAAQQEVNDEVADELRALRDEVRALRADLGKPS
jgi:voltage-gated potassium channel